MKVDVRRLLLGLVVLSALAPGHAFATDLAGSKHVRIDGALAGDAAGTSISGAGDVNDDGRGDVIIGAPNADNNGRSGSGSAYVIYGRPGVDPADIDLASASLGTKGFRIDGALAGDAAGTSVSFAGDANRDGIDDILVGAPLADRNGRTSSGTAYLIYGQAVADLADLDLAQLPTAGTAVARGRVFDGALANDRLGTAVDRAGQFNGSAGVSDDIILGAPLTDNNTRTDSGSAYVIYGSSTDQADLDLGLIQSTSAAAGMRVDGAVAGDNFGDTVSSGGDHAGSSAPDVLVGAPLADPNGASSGSVYVIYGSTTTDQTDFSVADIKTTQAARGRQIDGAAASDFAGSSLDGAATGFQISFISEAIIGAPGADNNSRSESGSVYAVPGTDPAVDPVDVDLGDAGTDIPGTIDMFRFDGPAAGSRAGESVASGTNLERTPPSSASEIVIGAPGVDTTGRTDAGAVFVMFDGGLGGIRDLALVTSSTTGTRIDGASAGEAAGTSVGVIPEDFDSDGVADAAIGAPTADNNTRVDSGSAYVPDFVPPETAITAGPANGSVIATPFFTLDYQGTPGADTVAFECERNFTPYVCEADGSQPFGLPDGAYNFRIAGVDGAGNADLTPAIRQFRIDTTDPVTSITGGPADGSATDLNDQTFSYSATDTGGSGVSGFRCFLDSVQQATCPFTGAAGSLSFTDIPDGTHTFGVAATDNASPANVDETPAERTFTVDTISPNATITGGPAEGSVTNDNDPVFTYSGSPPGDVASFVCTLDSNPVSPCSSSGQALLNVPDGVHTFKVTAVDAVGNDDGNPDSRTFTVDTGPPDTAITSGPEAPFKDATPTFAFSSTEGGSVFECRIDGAAFAACSGPGATHTPSSPLPSGAHSFDVRATDVAGNVDATPSSRAFEVRANQSPQALIARSFAGGEALLLDGASSVDPDGQVTGFRWFVDGALVATSAQTTQTFAPEKESYEVRLQVTDNEGGVGESTLTVGTPVNPKLAPCKLRFARARVFVFKGQNKIRLVVRYRSAEAAAIFVAFKLKTKKGKTIPLGEVRGRFQTRGIFRLPLDRTNAEMRDIRGAKNFSAVFRVPGTPEVCRRAFTRTMTEPRRVGGQLVWFQPDEDL